jgi:hypothetical protein
MAMTSAPTSKASFWNAVGSKAAAMGYSKRTIT